MRQSLYEAYRSSLHVKPRGNVVSKSTLLTTLIYPHDNILLNKFFLKYLKQLHV